MQRQQHVHTCQIPNVHGICDCFNDVATMIAKLDVFSSPFNDLETVPSRWIIGTERKVSVCIVFACHAHVGIPPAAYLYALTIS